MGWTWRYETHDGAPVAEEVAPAPTFPTQSDAETWLGEAYPQLVADGVDQVVLTEDSREVYGPMSLHPAP